MTSTPRHTRHRPHATAMEERRMLLTATSRYAFDASCHTRWPCNRLSQSRKACLPRGKFGLPVEHYRRPGVSAIVVEVEREKRSTASITCGFPARCGRLSSRHCRRRRGSGLYGRRRLCTLLITLRSLWSCEYHTLKPSAPFHCAAGTLPLSEPLKLTCQLRL